MPEFIPFDQTETLDVLAELIAYGRPPQRDFAIEEPIGYSIRTQRLIAMTTEWQIGDFIRKRWEIHQILHGGMGSVFIVYDHEWSEPFALKTFHDSLLACSPHVAERFAEEAHIWINLDMHENVTQAKFVQQIDGKPSQLFLEYVSGGDLVAWMIKHRLKKDVPLILRFAIQFCDGMVHAISKGMIIGT